MENICQRWSYGYGTDWILFVLLFELFDLVFDVQTYVILKELGDTDGDKTYFKSNVEHPNSWWQRRVCLKTSSPTVRMSSKNVLKWPYFPQFEQFPTENAYSLLNTEKPPMLGGKTSPS